MNDAVGPPLTDRARNRVFRYDLRRDDGTEVQCVAKFYDRAEDATRVADVLRAIAAAGTVAVPRVIRYDTPRLLLLSFEAGEAFTPALGADDGTVAAATGRALAALHAIRPPSVVDRVTSAAAILDDLHFRVAELRARLPGAERSLTRTLAELLRDLPQDSAAPSFVHGDFGPANLLWNGRDVVMLDFDRCARGDPALDLGTLFTQLHRSALRAPARLPNFAALRERVLEAYGAADRDLAARVAWYEHAVLVRKIHSLALDTKRHVRPERIRQRQAEAVRLLEVSHGRTA